MELTQKQKSDLKKALLDVATDDDKKRLSLLEAATLSETLGEMKKNLGEVASSVKSKEVMDAIMVLAEGMKKTRGEYAKWSSTMINSYKENSVEMVKSLTFLNDAMKTLASNTNFNKNAGPIYKTMINAIAGVELAVKTTQPVWRWPQYASVSVRNKSFENINPSTEDTLQLIPGLSIPEHDYINLSYSGDNITQIVYKIGGASGTTVATLDLTYSGSNILTITRTPQL